jgi:short-subunit dehydrogenase
MNETALITGASSGIGLELAKLLTGKNYNLVLVARSIDKLKELAAQHTHSKIYVIGKDLSTENAAQEIFDELTANNIHVDVLINNAGFGDYSFFSESNWQKQKDMINLNIMALTHLTHLFLPPMIKNKKGRVLNVASTAAFQPGPTMSVYYATKAYVLHFSEAIANELEGTGVTVTALCPGATESNFQNAADLHESKLVKGKKLPSSKEVADYAYQAMTKGKPVAIHGLFNYIQANVIRFLPRTLVTRMVRQVQDKAN